MVVASMVQWPSALDTPYVTSPRMIHGFQLSVFLLYWMYTKIAHATLANPDIGTGDAGISIMSQKRNTAKLVSA